MAKFKKVEPSAPAEEEPLQELPVVAAPAKVKRQRIGIVMKNFRHVVLSGPATHHRTIKGFLGGHVIFNEHLLDELLATKAPVEVYYRDVD